MTKKDYQAIARILYAHRQCADSDEHRLCLLNIGADLADLFAADNARFSRARFVEACETDRCKGMK